MSLEDGPSFSNDTCTVNVTSNEFEETITDELGDKDLYRVHGMGSRTDPLTTGGSDDVVNIAGEFAFLMPSYWRQ